MVSAIGDRVDMVDPTITPADQFDMSAVAAARYVSKHPSALVRWAKDGVLLRSGDRLYPEARKLPGGWRFSRRALDTFLARLTEDARGAARPSIDHAMHATADAALAAAGF